MLHILLQLASFFDKHLVTFSKMLSLEQIFFLIQCWTGFRHIIIKRMKNFPTLMGEQ
jgi:hypothetical protein